MPWWGWIAAGALLLSAEMGLVDAGFYLVFLGISALLVGLMGLAGVESPVWGQWLVFAGISLVSLVFFRQRVYSKIRRQTDLPEGVCGDTAIAQGRIEPGEAGRAKLRGSAWPARNVGDAAIEAGAEVRVERADGIELQVRSDAREG